MHRKVPYFLAVTAVVFACGCGAATVKAGADRKQIDRVIDDWHDAAAKADFRRYFGHMAAGSVFLGTDAGERWKKAEFATYAKPHFDKGKAWTMIPSHRFVSFAPDGTTAWFDEKLRHTKYGEVRGSGVVRRIDGTWRIVHYVLSFPVPNGVSKQVIAIIRHSQQPGRSPKSGQK